MEINEQALEALSRIARRPDLLARLPAEVIQDIIEDPEDGLAPLMVPQSILKMRQTTLIAGRRIKFASVELFQKDLPKGPKIGDVGINFGDWFNYDGGLIESNFSSDHYVQHYSLRKNSRAERIETELKVLQNKNLCKLWDVYYLMSRQPEGQAGPLALNENENIFYVKDRGGVVRRVHLRCVMTDTWIIDAHRLRPPRKIDKTARVFGYEV